jgi:hypothetical protein
MRGVLAALTVVASSIALGAGLQGLRPEIQSYAQWQRLAAPKDTGGAHPGVGKVVYANALAAKAWRTKGALPVGSIVVKTAGSSAKPSFVAVMLKRKDGWYYEEYFPRGARYVVGAGGPGGQALCVNCHSDAPRDALFTRP